MVLELRVVTGSSRSLLTIRYGFFECSVWASFVGSLTALSYDCYVGLYQDLMVFDFRVYGLMV